MATITWPDDVGPWGPYGGFGSTILAVIWMEFTLATVVIIMRVFTRYWCGNGGGWANLWAVISWFIGFLAQLFITVAIHKSINGFGPSWTVPTALMYSWVSIYLTFIAIGFGKFAIVAFVLALQGTTHIRLRYFLYFLAASNIIINVSFVLFVAFRCSPAHDAFVLGHEASCGVTFMTARNFGFFAGSWNAATDFFLALYPIHLLRGVAIPRKVKAGICAVMALGLLAFACACVKTYDLRYTANTTMLSYEFYCLTTWTYTEMWAVLITCSIPPLWPLAKRAHLGMSSRVSSARVWVGTESGSGSGSGSDRSDQSTILGSDSKSAGKSAVLLQQAQAVPTSRSVAEGMGPNTTTTTNPNPNTHRPTRSITPSRGHRFNLSRSRASNDRTGPFTRGHRSYAEGFVEGAAGGETRPRPPRAPLHDEEKGKRGDVEMCEVDDFGNSYERGRPGIMVTREYSVETEQLGAGGASGGVSGASAGVVGAAGGVGAASRTNTGITGISSRTNTGTTAAGTASRTNTGVSAMSAHDRNRSQSRNGAASRMGTMSPTSTMGTGKPMGLPDDGEDYSRAHWVRVKQRDGGGGGDGERGFGFGMGWR